MKTLKQKLTLIVAFLPLCAFAGPGTDGGNVLRSSQEDVIQAVRELPNKALIGLVSEAQTRQLLNVKYVEDQDVKDVLASMYKSWLKNAEGSGIELVWETGSVILQPKKICRNEKGEEVDASTKRERGAPICFNVNRLRRFPKDQLQVELANLALHELAHHFGHDEKHARKFQAHMREFVKNFFELRGLNEYLLGVSYREMRPGGIVDIETKHGKSQVACLTKEESPEAVKKLMASGDMSIIYGGAFLVKSSLNGPVAVSCRKYPVIECIDYLYSQNQKDYPRLIRAGICKMKGTSPAPATSEPQENTSAE